MIKDNPDQFALLDFEITRFGGGLIKYSIRDARKNEIVSGLFSTGGKGKLSWPRDFSMLGLPARDFLVRLGVCLPKQGIRNGRSKSETRAIRSFNRDLAKPSTKAAAVLWKKLEIAKEARKFPVEILTLSKLLFLFYLYAGKWNRSEFEINLAPLGFELPSAKSENGRANGCSWSPGGWWVSCCNAHDDCYERGGDEADRAECDARLYRCLVAKRCPLAALYYAAVRIFGRNFFSYHTPDHRARGVRKARTNIKPSPIRRSA